MESEKPDSFPGFAKLFPVILTAFIDFMGMSLVLPVMEPLIVENKYGLLPEAGAHTVLYGLMLASYPLSQFFGAPVLGALADRYGRRPLLLLSVFGSLIGYLIFGLGILYGSLPMLFAGRILDGFTGGNISIVFSAVADLTPLSQRPRAFGLVGASVGLGFVLGPAMGGLLSNSEYGSFFGPHLPLFVAAGFCAVNIFLLIFNFRETMKSPAQRKVNFFTGFRNVGRAFVSPNLRAIFSIVFFTILGFNFFTQFFPVALAKKWGMASEAEIGGVFAYIGFWMIFTQGVLIRILTKRYRPEEILRFTLISLSLTILVLSLDTPSWSVFFIAPPIAVSFGLSGPNLNTLVSSQASDSEQGQIMGINQSFNSLGAGLPAIGAGLLSLYSVNYPLITSAGFIFIGWLLFLLVFRKRNSPGKSHDSSGVSPH